MPGYFLDSSALGKRYHVEVGTDRIEALFQEPQTRRYISRLSVVEIQSVFAGKVRTRVITEAALDLLRARFLLDIVNHEVQLVRMTDFHYRQAERLIRHHGVARSLRTLDALQLAVALELHQHVSLDAFVCADHSLCGVAQAEGLPIINPELS